MVHPARWPMPSEGIQGYEWGAYVVLARSFVTEHGMAYGARALGSRSANSTRGRHAPPGRTGEPCTGGKWHRWLDDQALRGTRDADRRSRTGHHWRSVGQGHWR